MHPDHCIVYILTNEAMPDYIKIGTTRRPIEQRMRDLFSSAVPVPFECHYAARVMRDLNVEKRLHRAFDKYRVNKNREFFEIEPDAAAEILKMVALEDVTPLNDVVETEDDRVALRTLGTRAKRFSFKMLGLSPGTLLQHKNDADVTCRVVDNHNVEFKGDVLSLSAAALRALRAQGFDWKAAQGAQYWMHEGETLKALREKLENE